MFDWTRLQPGARVFTGDTLRCVAFPLGGIGTGTISLGGRGNLADWEIFNRPAKGRHLPYTFFSLWAKQEGGESIARVLERRLLPPYEGGSGLPTGLLSGLPRLDEAEFSGAYPLARIRFDAPDLPVRVSLESFNPFVPMDDLSSGIPAAVFVWTLENQGPLPVDLTVCLSMLNACGLDGTSAPGNRHHPQLGGNLNRFIEDGLLRGIAMENTRHAADQPQAGSMAIATLHPTVTYLTRWERAGWWDDVQNFWDDFKEDGRLPNGPDPEPSPDIQTDVGSLGAVARLAPGASVEIPFLITWRFPNLVNYWNHEKGFRDERIGNWYALQWSDAWSVARAVADELPRLTEETQAFAEAFFDSTLPAEVLDAASANISTIRTTTCLRTADGRFNAFEGCGDNAGCCPMNCTHVWNYVQAVAYLFPQLERSVRETDFCHNTRPSGDMAFRTLLPLKNELWEYKPAADGQMGTVMKVYREWLQCGDRAFLERLWPDVQRALEYAWTGRGWDADRDGVMEGEQHNTYDIEFHGPNTMMGTLYLGALRAAEEMAGALGLNDKATEYRALFEAGYRNYDALLWNGEYYSQIVLAPGHGLDSGELPDRAPEYPRYQYGRGCLSDHLLGQWFAHVVGLGDVLPSDHVRSALRAIFDHNFRTTLADHHSVQRVYAVNDESGLLLCTWPRGGRPEYPFPYSDEVWTGIEYQVAAHLLYEGLIDEGLAIVRAVRDRHDGAKRNPWNEPECGHHYARAMSSWSLITALTGYHYDASRRYLRLMPEFDGPHFRAFFSAGSAWGSFEILRSGDVTTVRIVPYWGEVTLQSVATPLRTVGEARASVDGEPVSVTPEGGALRFAKPIVLRRRSSLVLAG